MHNIHLVVARGREIVLDRKKTEERGKIILDKYKVGEDRSGDLETQKTSSISILS